MIKNLHKWNITYKEAIALQEKLRKRIKFNESNIEAKIVVGADVAYDKKNNLCIGACVVYDLKENKILQKIIKKGKVNFPYIPGLLSFREAPILLKAFNEVKFSYDVAILDGQGYAHPRRFGLASHISLWLNKPTIGCAKSRLIGEYKMPSNEIGDWSELKEKDEVIGAVVRTRKNVKPIFVSVGNQVNIENAIEIILKCCQGYRLPEPIRIAHNYVNIFIKKNKKQ